MNERIIAFNSLLSSKFIEDYIDELGVPKKENNLAKRLAVGTCQKELTLRHLALQLVEKLPRKRREKLLLYLCLYQYFFCDRIPLYAIIDQGVEIAKRNISRSYAAFLNATLRKIPETKFSFPEDISTKFSYPPYFVDQLVATYGLEKTKIVLDVMNHPPILFSRSVENPFESKKISSIEEGQYIQNVTPMNLMMKLKEGAPENILDIAASPGGKLLLAADLFPKAKLTANDVSPEKMVRLKENGAKWGVECRYTCFPGEKYPLDEKFDLIICDLPCSNSGVLNKRAQARWRITEENIHQIKNLQLQILERASKLLAPGGQIWYLTCSILQQENEDVVSEACEKFGLETHGQKHLYLPSPNGWDGGFGQRLVKSNVSD